MGERHPIEKNRARRVAFPDMLSILVLYLMDAGAHGL